MRWLLRHPHTRKLIGFSMFLANACAGVYFAVALMGLNIFIAGGALGIILGGRLIFSLYAIYSFRQEEISRSRNGEFFYDRTKEERTITKLIKGIVEKLNISLPHRTEIDFPHSIAEKVAFNACATGGGPVPARVQIGKGLPRAIKDKRISLKSIEATLAHEMSHIYNADFYYMQFCMAMTDFQKYSFYLSLAVTPLLCIVYPFSLLSMSAFLLANVGFAGCWLSAQIASGVIFRAIETAADFKACEVTHPKAVYENVDNLKKCLKIYQKEERENCREIDPVGNDKKGDRNKASPITKYFKSWKDNHPSIAERKADILSQYPHHKMSISPG